MSEKITRLTLTRYADLLGRESIALQALRHVQQKRAEGYKVEVHLKNNGFIVYHEDAGQKIARHFG